MSDDDWENDDFVPTLNTGASAVREEEDLLEKELNAQPVVSKLTEEQKAKKAAEGEAAFLKKLEATKIKEETADERRRRERLQVEEADHELTNELFDGMSAPPAPAATASKPVAAPAAPAASSAKPKSMATGLGGIPLTTNQDHFEFGNLVAVRLQDSTAFNVIAFYKGLSKLLKGSAITADSLDEISNQIKAIRDTKVKPVAGKKGEAPKESAADKKKKAKRHEELFGGEYDKADKYDAYNAIEDDFM